MFDKAIAANRFGLGVRPGEVEDPLTKDSLLAQFDRYDPRPAAFANAPTRDIVAAGLLSYFKAAREFQIANRIPRAEPAVEAPTGNASSPQTKGLLAETRRFIQQDSRNHYLVS